MQDLFDHKDRIELLMQDSIGTKITPSEVCIAIKRFRNNNASGLRIHDEI